MTSQNFTKLFIGVDASIRDAIACIDSNGKGIALIVDVEQRLVGTVSDGDIRRAMLAGENLDTSVQVLLDAKRSGPYAIPVTASIQTPPEKILALMQEFIISQVPLLDEEGRVVEVALMEEMLPDQSVPLQAVIMAGGEGVRLRPLTEDIPKPMLPVGDRPLMELVIEQLRNSGIEQINVSTRYLSDKIKAHFGDGASMGVELNYVTEDRPLGTAGALGLMHTPDSPLLVINGDILTRLDFRAMLAFHRKHKAELTVAVRQYDLQVPYGVVECNGPFVSDVREKPAYRFFVNAGIYLLEPSVLGCIPNGERYDMTDLIQQLLDEGQTVANFPIMEYWLDIGKYDDYQKAQDDVKNGRFKL
ncbi:MAG: nucleotidyltransferase family protein [Anaerolineaceae bacterium]|nr:nucleotidyltransferase family protein [Anaerolineaceae bacterium]